MGIRRGGREDLKASLVVALDDILVCVFRESVSYPEVNLDLLLLEFCCVNVLVLRRTFKKNPCLVLLGILSVSVVC